MSKELYDRNFDIYRLYKNGVSTKELCDKFGISRTRIHQILAQVRSDLKHKQEVEIPEIERACYLSDSYDGMYRRILNILVKANLHKRNVWKHASRDELLNIDGLGNDLVDIVLMAQTIKM